MGRTSPQGLTTHDFHPPPYVNPHDVFPKSRLAQRGPGYRSPLRTPTPSRSPSRFAAEARRYVVRKDDDGGRPSSALSCCAAYDDAAASIAGSSGTASGTGDESALHSSPSPMDCEYCVDDCEDCVEEHEQYRHRASEDDCRECQAGPSALGPACTDPGCHDMCDVCDFSCFDCIDWNQFERDKSLGLSFAVPLLGDTSTFLATDPLMDEPDGFSFPPADVLTATPDLMASPLDIPMHHQCVAPYWASVDPSQLCSGHPGATQQLPLPAFGLEFGCHPATAHQQTPLPTFPAPTAVPYVPPAPPLASPVARPGDPLSTTDDLRAAVSAPSTSKACQWLMPCGTVCGAAFATATDLKKHLKTVHLMKGVMKCGWQDCDSAVFASEAALTGHISKKHLAPMLNSHHPGPAAAAAAAVDGAVDPHPSIDGGPFKCTFPGCPKAFMYKQVRDEHVASCHNGNKMYCHICGQFLNGEGSNFKRHMATHRPKHQHMLCKFHGWGCKRRFPRLDNLRRHEACCKFGKKAALAGAGGAVAVGDKHHHHHHHVHDKATA